MESKGPRVFFVAQVGVILPWNTHPASPKWPFFKNKLTINFWDKYIYIYNIDIQYIIMYYIYRMI